ncbi:hypothetical protein [Ottowia oryzae]
MKPALAPLLAGAFMAFASWYFGWSPHLPDQSAVLGFAGSVASISATMLGFMLAALAVLASISNTTLVERMKKTRHYEDLLTTIFVGCVLFLAIALCGFAVLFGLSPSRGMMAAMIALHAAALVSLLDIGRKFRLVLVNLL